MTSQNSELNAHIKQLNSKIDGIDKNTLNIKKIESDLENLKTTENELKK